MSIIAYLWFVGAIIVLVQNPTDKFLKFHAWQSIYLSGVWIAIWIVLNIVMGAMYDPYRGGVGILGLFGLLTPLLSLAFLVAWIMCVVKAYQGETYKLPVIGDMAEKQAAK